MEQNVIQINGGITINVDASVNNIIYVKNNMFRNLLFMKIFSKYYGYYEIIDVNKMNLMKKIFLCFAKFLYFNYLFINYHYMFDSC